MNCTQVYNMQHDFLDGNLSPMQQEGVQQHLNECDACRQQVVQLKTLLQTLRDVPAPAPRPGFEQRIFSVIAEDTKPAEAKHSHWFAAGFGSALAAGLALWLVFTPGSYQQPSDVGVISIQLIPDQPKNVSLVFNSPQDIQDATLTLQFSNEIELAGFPGKHHLQWQTALKKGSNRLSLPLVAKGNNGGNLLATITRNGQTRTFRVNIKTAIAPTSEIVNPNTLSG